MVQLIFLFFAFVAEVIGTMAGFGSSTLLLPMALFFMDFNSALVLVAFFHLFGNMGRTAFFRHGFDRRLLLVFGVPGFAFALAGSALAGTISQEILKLCLGIFLMAYALFSFLKPGFVFPATDRNAIAGGAFSGFFAGLIGTGGALRSAFLSAFPLKKEVYLATAAVIALAVDAIRIPVYLTSGFMQKEEYALLPALFLIALAGSFTGKKIVSRVSQEKFRKIVLLALLLAGIKLVYDSVVSGFTAG